jgi:hypothetical protein
MAGGGGDEDDGLARRDAAGAVDDVDVVQARTARGGWAISPIAVSVKPG